MEQNIHTERRGMSDMKRRGITLVALVLCITMILAMVPAASAATGDEVRAAKKVISVVYDDSGSMYGDRWVYANYAMQALTALLNTQDELYITYMSEPTVTRSVSLADINGAVTGIRDWKQSGNTPGQALETAYDKLKGVSKQDPSVQFWMIVLTDGEVTDLKDTLQKTLNNYKGTTMNNGTPLNVVYLAMGNGARSLSPDTKHGLYTYKADQIQEISKVMAEIANLVSSRLDADKVKQVDDKTISFQSDLPLYSISVLAQQSTASVVSAATAEEPLNIQRNIPLDSKDPFGYSWTNLYGNATVINLAGSSGTGQIIPAGTYTITFSEPVDVANLLVQYEPAIAMMMITQRDGIEITDPSVLVAGDKVNIELIPVIPGTDQRISDSSLPKGITWKTEYIVDDTLLESGDDRKLTGIVLQPGDNTIRGTMQLPGFAPSVYDIYFYLEPYVYDPGIQVDQPEGLSYYRRNTGDQDPGEILFRVTNEGNPLDKDQQKEMGLKLKVDSVTCDNSAVTGFLNRFGKVLAACDLKVNDDGSYTLRPHPIIPFTSFLTMAGDYTVTVCIESDPGVTAVGTFTMVAQPSDWIELGGLIGLILFLLYLIYILFIKYKFKGQTVCYQAYRLRYDGSGIEMANDANTIHLNPLKNVLSLKRASETKCYGLTLQAGPDGSVIVTGKSIAKQVSHYKATSMDPKVSLDTIVASMQATTKVRGQKTERTASDQVLTNKRPVYFRTSEGDKIIWCLYLLQ